MCAMFSNAVVTWFYVGGEVHGAAVNIWLAFLLKLQVKHTP